MAGISWSLQLEFLLRLLAAAVCGVVIGLERETHMKTVGIRTHLVVALAATTIMLVSKYGFFDVLAMNESIKLDPSRVASGAVTAVGFLGTGIIFVRKQNVSGLTTSAGIWATVGVGTAIGAGMYLVGAALTIFIILAHMIFHKKSKFIKDTIAEQLTLEVSLDENIDELLDSIFNTRKISVSGMKAKKTKNSMLELSLTVRYPEGYREKDIIQLIKDVPSIKSIEM